MSDLSDIDGVGPARAETLQEAGYETIHDVATADEDELDEALGSGATASTIIEAAQEEDEEEANFEPADETEEVESEDDEEVEVEEDDVEAEPDGDSDDGYRFDLNRNQQNHLLRALVEQEVNARRTNQPGRVEAVLDAIEEVRSGEPYDLTEQQLNLMYSGINQLENEYRGLRGISGFTSEVRDARIVIDNARKDAHGD